MELSNFDIDERGVMLIPANEANLSQLSEANKIGVREIKMHNEVVSIASQFSANARLLTYVHFSDRLEVIPKEAFLGCVRLACVDLPAQLNIIENRAFMDSGVEYLHSDSVKLIGDEAFLNCNLTKLEFGQLKIVGKNAFAGNKKLKEAALPESVIEIGEGAFAGCFGVKQFVVGPNVVKMGNPFKSELFIHKGKMPLSIMMHLNSVVIKINGLEPIKGKDFVSLEVDSKTNLRIVHTLDTVWVETLDRVRGVSEFTPHTRVEFEATRLKPQETTKLSWLNEGVLIDYLKQSCGINVDKMSFCDDIQKLTTTKSKFVELSFNCSLFIDVANLKKFCAEHNNYLLEYLKTQNTNLDAVSVRTHQLNWQKLFAKLSNEQKNVHRTALDLLSFKEKIFMATFGDSFDNIATDKVRSEQLNFLIKEATRLLETRWIEADEDNSLGEFTTELDEENNRLCKALTMQEYISKLNIDKESFYQLADILVQNPNQWEEYLESDEDSAVVGFVKALEHEYNWQSAFAHMNRKQRELYTHYKDDLLPAELHRTKVKYTREEFEEFIKTGLFNFQTMVLSTSEVERYQVMERFIAHMDKAHTFAVLCKQEAEKQFKLAHKRPKERDEIKKWEQDLTHAGEDAYYAKYNEIMQKVENDKVDYRAVLHVCKVEFKGKPVGKNLQVVQKLRGKISKLKFKSLHIDRELSSEFL